MATEVPMPKMGLTMEEAMIVEWLVADGTQVEPDTPIVFIETDKTETEVGSPGAGWLHITGQPGTVYRCGERIGWLLAEGEAVPTETPVSTAPSTSSWTSSAAAPSTILDAASSAIAPVPTTSAGRLLASPNARRVAAELGVNLSDVRGSGPDGRIVSEDVEAAASAPRGKRSAPAAPTFAAAVDAGLPVVASAAARQLADLLGVDLRAVPIDLAEMRVTRDGVALYVRQRLQGPGSLSPAPAPGATPGATPAPSMPLLQEPTSMVRLGGMRGTIAKRMHASLQETAQLTLTMDAEMDAILADRAARKLGGALPVPSITDYIVAAVARTLPRHPTMNAQVTDAGIAILPEVHVGLAVAVDGGLLVPVVRDAGHRDLADLAAETTRLATAARDGRLGPADLEGGTFSVSALGAFGVDVFTPVINPPNVGILGVGRLRDDVVVSDGQVGTVKRLTLSLTWDHRVLDGVPAAEFCRDIVALLADPDRLA